MKVIVIVSILMLTITILSPYYANASSGHHSHMETKCKPGFTHLWEFANPVTDIGCVLLTHPSSSVMAKENQNNIRFDSGIEAAYKAVHEEGKSRSAPCSSSDKNWCDGWMDIWP